MKQKTVKKNNGSVRAKETAYALLSEYGITSVNLESIIYVTENKGIELFEYGSENYAGVENLLRELKLENAAAASHGFAFSDGMNNIIFVREKLTAEEKLLVIAHELGHILLGHLKGAASVYVGASEEYEANEFVHYLMNAAPLLRIKIKMREKRRAVVGIAAAVIIIAAGICTAASIMKYDSAADYYITETGEKYHQADCVTIRGKKVHKMTEEERESGKYTPCAVCLPEK